jgi:hypothetical protein
MAPIRNVRPVVPDGGPFGHVAVSHYDTENYSILHIPQLSE